VRFAWWLLKVGEWWVEGAAADAHQTPLQLQRGVVCGLLHR
jgi:hypothetical protein